MRITACIFQYKTTERETQKAKGNQNIEEAKNLRSRMFSIFSICAFIYKRKNVWIVLFYKIFLFIFIVAAVHSCVLFIAHCPFGLSYLFSLSTSKSLRHFTSISHILIVVLLFCYFLMFLFQHPYIRNNSVIYMRSVYGKCIHRYTIFKLSMQSHLELILFSHFPSLFFIWSSNTSFASFTLLKLRHFALEIFYFFF